MQGRPFEDPVIKKVYKRFERMEEIERAKIESRIGIQMWTCGMNLVKAKTPDSAMTMLIAFGANIGQRMSGILFALFGLFLVHRLGLGNSRCLTKSSGVGVGDDWNAIGFVQHALIESFSDSDIFFETLYCGDIELGNRRAYHADGISWEFLVLES
jgi:hypothetical protein